MFAKCQAGRSCSKAQRAKGLRRKVWTQTKILNPNIQYFVSILRFVVIYALPGNLWAKKCSFGSKNRVSWAKIHYYMVSITNYTELNLQICNYAQKQRICCKKSNYALDASFHGHFCPRRKAANFCHPARYSYREVT